MTQRVNELGSLATLLRAVDRLAAAGGADGAAEVDLVAGEWLAATGLLAGAIAGDLAPPMEAIHGMLAEVVEMLDVHAATSRGPRPLPIDRVGEVRRVLTDAFLMSGRVSRLATDLAMITASADAPGAREPVDVNNVVERTVALARRRLTQGQDIRVNLGRPPRLETERATLAQLVAQLLFVAAYLGGERARITVATSSDPVAREAVITASHDGTPVDRLPLGPLIERTAARLGGRAELDDRRLVVRLPAGA